MTAYTYTPINISTASFIPVLSRLGVVTEDINNSGQVVGRYFNFEGLQNYRSFIESDGIYTLIHVPGAISTQAKAINDSGQVAGYYIDSNYIEHGFTESNGVYTTLNFPGAINIYPTAINNFGQVAGYYIDSNNIGRGFVESNGVYTTLNFPGAINTDPRAINDSGQIVGVTQIFGVNFVATPTSVPTINFGSFSTVLIGKPTVIEGISIAGISDDNDTVTVDILASKGILTDTANNVTISNNGSNHITISGNLVDVNSALLMLNYTGQVIGSDTLTVTVTDNGTGFSTTNSITQTIMSGVYNYFFAVANPSSFISTSIPINTVLGRIIPLDTNLNPSFSFNFAQDAQGNEATQSLNGLTINPTTGVVTTAVNLNPSIIDEWVTIRDNTGSSYTGKFELIFSGAQTNITGSANNDFIIANAATKLITANEGNDTLTGQTGKAAIAFYRGTKSEYNITKYSDHVVITDTVANRDGTDTLYNIPQIQFNTGGNLIYDIPNTNNNALIDKLYQANFGRCLNNAGLHYWVDQLNVAHKSIEDITNGFIASQEFANRFGSNVTNAQFVDKLYNNILNRGGETAGVTYWNNELDMGHKDKVMALIGFAVSPEDALKTAGNIDNRFLVS